jgi:hypothetical protein
MSKLITRTVALGAVGAAGGVGLACLGGAAQATTADNVGLPIPKVQISNHIGWAFEGRFFLKRAPRSAKVTAAQLDIADITSSEPSFYFGELKLRTYTSSGTPTTALFDLWWFYFHRKENRLTARVIPPGSISPEHLEGKTAGMISFAVPGGRTGTANNGNVLRSADAKLTLGGHSYALTFSRTSSDSPNIGVRLPPAELYGR